MIAAHYQYGYAFFFATWFLKLLLRSYKLTTETMWYRSGVVLQTSTCCSEKTICYFYL